MKTPTIPTLLGPDGMTSLREYAGYHGGGSGFGGQLRAWNPPGESVDAALLPNFTRGNARADDLVRNNGYAANAIQLHQDHIVGSFFRLSHRPSWRYLGIGEEEARAFSREVEAAWKEFAEDDCCCIDVERKRTFTMMIREGVAMHAFNGELFVQATWDTSPSRLFRTQFRMVSPKRISNPNNTGDSRNCRAGVQINDSGAALGYYVSEDGYPGWMPQKWTWIPRELPGGRASFIHVFEPVEDGQTRGANVFYSVMEQMMSGRHCSPGWMQPAGCLRRRCRHISACPCRLCWIPRLQCTAVRRPLMPDWLMNLSTAPMRSPLCVMHWMHVNPVSQEGE